MFSNVVTPPGRERCSVAFLSRFWPSMWSPQWYWLWLFIQQQKDQDFSGIQDPTHSFETDDGDGDGDGDDDVDGDDDLCLASCVHFKFSRWVCNRQSEIFDWYGWDTDYYAYVNPIDSCTISVQSESNTPTKTRVLLCGTRNILYLCLHMHEDLRRWNDEVNEKCKTELRTVHIAASSRLLTH